MFDEMTKRKRDTWLAKPDCPILATVQSMISAAQTGGGLREIQINAIKTDLFLKIKCGNKPLAEFFSDGALTSLELNYSMLLSSKLWSDTIPFLKMSHRIRTSNICDDETEFCC